MKESICFRRIEKDEDLRRFSEFTSAFIGVNYPLEYLRRAQVIVMVPKHDPETPHFMGGYVIATEGPFRVIQQLPEGVLQGRTDLEERLKKAVELTGLWIHPRVKGGRTRFRFWWNLFISMLRHNLQGRPYMVYSYDAEKDKLSQMYSLSQPQRIFRGHVYIEGMKGESEEIVEIGSTRAVVLAFLLRPHCISRFITRRLFRRKNFLGKVAKA